MIFYEHDKHFSPSGRRNQLCFVSQNTNSGLPPLPPTLLKTIFLCLKTTPLAGQRVSVGRIGYFSPNKKLLMITNLNAMFIFNQSYIQFIKSWKRDHKNNLLIKLTVIFWWLKRNVNKIWFGASLMAMNLIISTV